MTTKGKGTKKSNVIKHTYADDSETIFEMIKGKRYLVIELPESDDETDDRLYTIHPNRYVSVQEMIYIIEMFKLDLLSGEWS